MRKRIISIVLIIAMVFISAFNPVQATEKLEASYNKQANILKQINLFYGTNEGFELERACGRVEGTVVFLRLIGEEKIAKEKNYAHNFVDVTTSAKWASPYIGYAYVNKLAYGVSDTEFGVEELSATQFATFLLRSIGYSDVEGDFTWKTAMDKMVDLDILLSTDAKEILESQSFTRDLLVKMCYKTLFTQLKGTKTTLISYLLEKGVFTEEQLKETNDGALIEAGKAKSEPNPLPDEGSEQPIEPENPVEPEIPVEPETPVVPETPDSSTIAVSTIDELQECINNIVYVLQPRIQIEFTNSSITSLDVRNYLDELRDDGIIRTYSGTIYSSKVDLEVDYGMGYKIKQYIMNPSHMANEQVELKEIAAIVKGIIDSTIDNTMTDYEKEKAIHDYMVLTYRYDYENYQNNAIPDESYTVAGMLKYKTGVCQAYAETFKLFMDILGIDCQVVIGTGNGGSHAWNIVKLDGEYYQVDVTWNDPVPDIEGQVRYNYFNITDEKMAIDHVWDTQAYVACNGTKYDYYRMSNLYVESREELKAMITSFLANGGHEFQAYCGFDISEEEDYSNIAIDMLRAAGYRQGMTYYHGDRNLRIILGK